MGSKCVIGLIFALAAVAVCPAQTKCINSWKKGDHRILEEVLSFTLDPRTPELEHVVKTDRGRVYGKLIVAPGWAGTPRKIIEWRIELIRFGDEKEIDLLKPTDDPNQDSFGAEDFPGWFVLGPNFDHPDKKPAFGLTTIRAVKIDQFYSIMSLTAFERDSVDSFAFKSSTFQIRLTNQRPKCI